MTTFAIATLGCKVNTYESQHYLESMKALGYVEVRFREVADVYIINTCCVTNTAAAKSRQKIHQARKQNPQALIALIGCYAQTASTDALAALQADVIIGAGEKGTLAKRITQALKDRPHSVQTPGDARALRVFEPLNVHAFSHQSRAFLKVQDGCNQFCSYCIIPYARGSERSIDLNEAITIAEQMAANGHQEIVLSGIHTGRYGRERGTTLLALLQALVAHTPPHVRFRISSIEMNEIDDALIDYMRKEQRIARHLHIPIQAADDALLRAMNRPYDTAWFLKRMNAIRQALPDVSISTDMIVGFPGESDAQFNEALQRVENDLRFSFIHCFPYSRRAGTVAAQLPMQIENSVKKERVKALSALSQKLHHAYMETFIGKTLDVIIETKKGNVQFGHSSEYLPVYVQTHTTCSPKRIQARVCGFYKDGLLGEESEGTA